MQDSALLTQYAQTGSEAAFSQLLAKHLPLVYRTCRRELASDTLAEDAAQVVFLLLARKSKTLRAGPNLAGWLYQTSVFVAKDIRKQEARRLGREEAVMQETVHPQSASASDRDTVEPHLNAALSALKPADRDAVLLRFLEGHTLAETGALLGVTEDAARMRCARALEKLRRYLTAHGAAVTGVVLAALLTAEAARPVSAQAASTVTQGTLQALTNGPTPNVLLLSKGVSHTMKIIKIKYAALAAGLLLVGASVPPLVHAFSSRPAILQQASLTPSSPNPNFAGLTIPGDYTLTYTVQQKDFYTPEQRKALRDKLYQDLLSSPFHPVSSKQYKPGEDVPPDVAAKANDMVDQSLDPKLNSQPMTLTLSAHAGKFLYRLLSRHSDPTSFVVGDAAAPVAMLYGGDKSFMYGYSDHRTMLWDNFDGEDSEFLPVLSTHLADIAVYKDIQSLGGGDYKGNVFDPGGGGNKTTERLSYANTKVHLEKVDSLPRVTKITVLGPDGSGSLSTENTAFVRFKGVWVPSQIVKTIDTRQVVWTLTGTSPKSVDPAEFDYHTYLQRGDIVQDNTNPKGPQIITFAPGMDIFAQWH